MVLFNPVTKQIEFTKKETAGVSITALCENDGKFSIELYGTGGKKMAVKALEELLLEIKHE